jgi:hypothetical protein
MALVAGHPAIPHFEPLLESQKFFASVDECANAIRMAKTMSHEIRFVVSDCRDCEAWQEASWFRLKVDALISRLKRTLLPFCRADFLVLEDSDK